MKIDKIEAVTKAKSRVYADEHAVFILYNKEISRYHLTEGGELSEAVYREIEEEILLKRAKLRAMHLLQKMDRTYHQLRMKLVEGEYPEEVINAAMAYVEKFHYLDDERYAEHYVDTRKKTKSRRQIAQELDQKGIAKDTARAALEEYEPEQEREAILEWMRKKRFSPEEATLQERQKMYGFLLRKGFRMSDVLSCLRMDSD